MRPKKSRKKSSIQTHSADACEHAPFDRKEHLKRAMQKKQEKAGKKRGAVAYAIQLKQKDVQLHGPRHLKAAMEQHAGMLSSVVTKAPDADTWEADPSFKLFSNLECMKEYHAALHTLLDRFEMQLPKKKARMTSDIISSRWSTT